MLTKQDDSGPPGTVGLGSLASEPNRGSEPKGQVTWVLTNRLAGFILLQAYFLSGQCFFQHE